MRLISTLNFLLVFSLLFAVGLCRPSDEYDEQVPADSANEENDLENEEEVQGPKPVIKTKSMSFSVEAGDTVTLPCEAENSDAGVQMWYNGTQSITQDGQVISRDTHRISKKGASLQIQNVTTYDSGLYTCKIILGDNANSPNVTHSLHVKQPAKIDVFIPSEPKLIIQKGKTLKLSCNASGYPQPKVFWNRTVKGSKSPEPLPGTEHIIQSVNREHSGTYECTAKNGAKDDTRSVEVLVQYEPEISIKSETVNTAEGQVTEMHCTVYAEPPALLIWLKGDKKLTSNDHIHLNTDPNKPHKHVLRIENTKAEDFGTYICIASNSIGTTRKQIFVSDSITNEILQSNILEANPNEASQFRISAALIFSILVARFFC